MSYTKLHFVETAFEEIAMAGYVFDLTPELKNAALRRLDAMMAEWNGKAIRLGYPIPANPQDSVLDDPTIVPNWAWEAVYTNLALKLCAMLGKTPPVQLMATAKTALTTVMNRSLTMPQMQLPGTMPVGAGNRPIRIGQTYVQHPVNQSLPLPEDDLTFSN